jgi:hypothetical protein
VPCVKAAASYIIPEIVNYAARKLVSYIKSKGIKKENKNEPIP